MPHRSFTITLPADTVYHQLYGQMLLVTGAIPTDGIAPDRKSTRLNSSHITISYAVFCLKKKKKKKNNKKTQTKKKKQNAQNAHLIRVHSPIPTEHTLP